jgi:dephospho-CoA kinase
MTGVARTVPVLGLVGGVGSGKSFVAAGLAARRRVAVIAADPIGHDVLKGPEVKARLRRAFGPEVFTPEGEIDRPKLGALVFGDEPETQVRRKQLEDITHPEITREVQRQIANLRGQPGLEAIVIDAALLLEAGWRRLCDRVVFVESRESDRQQRVALARGWSPGELARREASQWSLERKRAACDGVVTNSGSTQAVDELERLLDSWLDEQNTTHSPPGGVEVVRPESGVRHAP